MMQHFTFGITLVLLVVCLAVADWSAEEYPDPQLNMHSCSRGNKRSSVCDPDGIISVSDSDKLDKVIAEAEHDTKTVCQNNHAYRIRVALVKKLKEKTTHALTGTEDEKLAKQMKRTLDLTRSFASKTHKQWNHNKECHVDIVIVYSRQDGTFYTFAGERVINSFSPFIINEIVYRAKVEDDNLAEGLSKVIRNYGKVFDDTYQPSYTLKEYRPKYAPVKLLMTSSGKHLQSHTVVLLAATFILFLSRSLS